MQCIITDIIKITVNQIMKYQAYIYIHICIHAHNTYIGIHIYRYATILRCNINY